MSSAAALIRQLNPVIRGWANYHRHVVASCIFSRVDLRHLLLALGLGTRLAAPPQGRALGEAAVLRSGRVTGLVVLRG